VTSQIGLLSTTDNSSQQYLRLGPSNWGATNQYTTISNAQSNSASWGSANVSGMNALWHPVGVPIDTFDEWGTDAIIDRFTHEQSDRSELLFDTDVSVPLEEAVLTPPHAQTSLLCTSINPRMVTPGSVDTPDLDGRSGLTSNIKRRPMTSKTLGHVMKRRRDNIACARCWFSKKKVRSQANIPQE
jgi:hypothetical protein